jgi:arylsulfatase A-like enzyme
MVGNHQQLLKGPQLYDDLARVPLILSWSDKIAPGSKVTELVQWIDLPATVLEASGRAPGRGVQGRSVLPLINGEAEGWRPWAMTEYRYAGFETDRLSMTTMLRHENWKLIVWHGSSACGNTRDGELYDLARDPGKLDNLFHDPDLVDQRRAMKGLMLEAMAQAEDKTNPQTRAW